MCMNTLYVTEKEEKRKAEYDMNTKAMMAPPKALDEEDINHLNSIQERYDAEKKKQLEEESRELEKFRASRFGNTPLDQSTPLSSSSSSSSRKEAEFILPIKTKSNLSATQSTVILAKKRKIINNNITANKREANGECDDNGEYDKNRSAESDKFDEIRGSCGEFTKNNGIEPQVSRSTSQLSVSSGLTGLGGYGSDSDCG